MRILRIVILGGLCLAFASACIGNVNKDVIPESRVTENAADDICETEPDTEKAEGTSPTSADVTLDEDDRSLIAWLIACEIGDRPYEAQVCFASVILNRVGDSGFSESVRGVIFESGDFLSVSRGNVTGGVGEAEKSSQKYKIAKAALDEALRADPTGGALYFGYIDDGKSAVTGSYECGGMFFSR